MKQDREKFVLTCLYPSCCGALLLGSFAGRLCLCDWAGNEHRRALIDRRIRTGLNAGYKTGMSDVLTRAIAQLDEYFARQRTAFDIPLLGIGTEFQRAVWAELQRIPYGETLSYKELAIKTGRPQAVRAIASANGANPLSLFVPCHRVIGSNGKLTGYAGGLEAKSLLLELERTKTEENRLLCQGIFVSLQP